VARSDKHHSEEINVSIRYSEETIENLQPEYGISYPVQGPSTFSKVEKWKVDRVYYFLCFTTIICIGALIWRPLPDIQATVASTWVSAATLSRYLLKNAYHGAKNKHKKRPKLFLQRRGWPGTIVGHPLLSMALDDPPDLAAGPCPSSAVS